MPRRRKPKEVAPYVALDTISLCTGYGGLDLGLAPFARAVCYVEREPYCAQLLQERIADGKIDPAPVWDELTTFDGKPWRGCVDLVSGGIPCQPHSTAGDRLAGEDERDLWPEFLRILDETAAPFAFVENVRGLLSSDDGRFFQGILADLADRGFDAAWCVLRASDVGAPHRRARVFLLAWSVADARCAREQLRGATEYVAGAARDG